MPKRVREEEKRAQFLLIDHYPISNIYLQLRLPHRHPASAQSPSAASPKKRPPPPLPLQQLQLLQFPRLPYARQQLQ
jgi:hypothetical protein